MKEMTAIRNTCSMNMQGCGNWVSVGSNDPPPGNLPEGSNVVFDPRFFGNRYFPAHRSVDSQ